MNAKDLKEVFQISLRDGLVQRNAQGLGINLVKIDAERKKGKEKVRKMKVPRERLPLGNGGLYDSISRALDGDGECVKHILARDSVTCRCDTRLKDLGEGVHTLGNVLETLCGKKKIFFFP